MSRDRIRPTRQETREQLFEAAARVFTEQGVGASVEAISAAAGLTRGAFYSNFGGKDELITAMLADHIEQTVRRYLELLARHRDPDDFMAALRLVDRSGQDPLGRSPLLHLELLLYAARAAARGEEREKDPAEFLRARRRLIADIVAGIGLARPGNGLPGPEQVASMLLAMEDGFRLHQLIDPDGTPPDSFVRAVSALQEAFRPAPGAPSHE
jgi:AcrR family transcriptional regulator